MQVERLHPLDAGAAQQLLLRGIGSLYPVETLRRLGFASGAVALGAHEQPRDLLGVGIAELPGPEAAAPFGAAAAAALAGHRTGWLSQLAVRSTLRGQGVGRALIAALSAWMVAQGCDQLAAVAWMSGGPHQSAPLLVAGGCQELAEAGRRCPRCCGGGGCFSAGCSCWGRLYVRDLSPAVLTAWQRGRPDGTSGK